MNLRGGAWLQLFRASNFPTVISNALTGCAVGVASTAAYPWRAFAVSAAALVLVYAAGMALNDALDVETDSRERPERPIPSGRITRRAALAAAAAAAATALVLLASTGKSGLIAGAALVACVLLYDLTHQLHAASVVLMAGCRALAIITAAAAAGGATDWRLVGIVAGTLGLYIVALSLIARGEAGDVRRIRAVVFLVCAVSLLDALFLIAMQRWPQALAAAACFTAALAGQRRILGS